MGINPPSKCHSPPCLIEVQLFLLGRQCSPCFVALVNFPSFEVFKFSCFASISIFVGKPVH